MTSGKLTLIAALLTGLSAAGCCQDQDNKIKELNLQNAKLNNDVKAYQDQVAAANKSEADAIARADAKDADLMNKDMEIRSLKDQLTKKGPSPSGDGSKTATGWIAQTFGDSVTVGSDILFGSGKAALTPAGKQHLDKIIHDIRTSYANRPIRIYGHTDSDPIKKSDWQDNLELSGNRAMAVTRYLIDKGVKAAYVETIAMSEWHPEGKDKTKNRRVEIFAVKALPGGPSESKSTNP